MTGLDAVGDEAFMNERLDKLSQFRSEGKTIVSVFYALNTAKALQHRSSLLNKGGVATIGNIEKVMNNYLAMLQEGTIRASFGRKP